MGPARSQGKLRHGPREGSQGWGGASEQEWRVTGETAWLQGGTGCWLCPRWAGGLAGPQGDGWVSEGVRLVAPWCREGILPQQGLWPCWLSWPCWLQAALMATGLATPCGHKPAPSWPKTIAPSHLGREEPGSSLPAPSLVLGIRGRKAQPAMSPALLQAPAQGGESQQCWHASHCPHPP